MNSLPERYSRQVLFSGIGPKGQDRMAHSTAAVVGLGALGSISSAYLARAGVGHLHLIDRDLVEPSNLQRQVLYDENDARGHCPKAAAAERHLRQANSEIEIVGHVEDLTAATIARLLEGVDLVLDGTDNFETRFLLNEWSVRERVPWIYAAAVGAYGVTFPILPGETACLACVFEPPPPADVSPTCETDGILGPVAGAVASVQTIEALRILSGTKPRMRQSLNVFDLWSGRIQQVGLQRQENPDCRVCGERRFPHLEARAGSVAVRLCGRNAVQVTPVEKMPVDLPALARRLGAAGHVVANRFLVRVQLAEGELTVFADGRSLVRGTDDLAMARSLVARYIGS
ncbi:MAG: ThiF family adenylyltransferase [Acidobacteriota bacterium]